MALHPNSLENLKKGKPHQFRSGEPAAKKSGSKGAHSTNRKRRERMATKEAAAMVLSLIPECSKEMRAKMEKFGMQKDATLDTRLISLVAITSKAMRGDTKALEFMLNAAGEATLTELDALKAEGMRRDLGIDQDAQEEYTDADIAKRMDEMTDEQLAQYESLCAMFRGENNGGDSDKDSKGGSA